MTKSSELLAAFEAWAARRRRVCDLAVLSAVLSAHEACVAEASGSNTAGRVAGWVRTPDRVLTWRAGEAYDAVVRAAATESAALLAGTDVLRETLDSFFRFLRNTGRLRSGSADVVALRQECCRAVGLVERAGEGARLLWPIVSGETGWPDADDEDEWLASDDPRRRTRGVLRMLGLHGPPDVPLPPAERAARLGAESDYMRLLLRLTDLVAAADVRHDGRVLPCPEDAGRLTDALDITAGEFKDLWLAGLLARVIRRNSDRSFAVVTRAEFEALPAWQRLSALSEVAKRQIDQVLSGEAAAGAIALLAWSLQGGGSWVPVGETVGAGARADLGGLGEWLSRADAAQDHCIWELVKAGLLERGRGHARLTDLGMWAVDGWIRDQFDTSWR